MALLSGALASAMPALAQQEGGSPARPAATAPDSTKPVVRAVDITGASAAPRIDGWLNDAVWASAPLADGFTQMEPDPGARASERTEVHVLYDREALYVGVRLRDSDPNSITAPVARRDVDLVSDWFYVAIDTDKDGRTAYMFGVNPRGVKRDLLLFDDVREDIDWNAVWEAGVRTDSLGWYAEFRIPLSQLRIEGDGGDGAAGAWGIDFQRRIARRGEIDHWSPVPPRGRRMVSVFGELRGVGDVSAPSRVEIRPYSVARLTRAPGDPTNPLYRPNDLFGSVGLDLKYGITSNLTSTASINPDFSQVEADPSVVNTSGYRVYLPEKRPFFLDDAQLFDVRVDRIRIFHSRRIGREPQRDLDVDHGFVQVPEAATILGAGKIVGETSNGWSIGMLATVTEAEDATIADTTGARHTEPVEPLTAAGVARIEKEFGNSGSSIGGIFTAARRQLGQKLDFLTSAAYVGGLDARVRFGSGNYEIAASVLESRVEGSAEAIDRLQLAQGRFAQRPDAPHLSYDSTRTFMRGMAATASIARDGRGAWTWSLAGHAITPGFEVNDLGYQRNADVAAQSSMLGYDLVRGDAFIRRVILELNQWSSWTFGRERTALGGNLDARIVFGNFWGLRLGLQRDLPALDPDGLRGGPALQMPATTRAWATINSDRRRRVDGQISATLVQEDETQARMLVLNPLLRGRPSNFLELAIEPEIVWRFDAETYIGQRHAGGRTHYLFADVDQTTASVTTRIDLALSPTLSLRFYAQPYLTARSYSEYKEVVDPKGAHFGDRFRSFSAGELSYDSEDERYFVTLADGSGTLSFQNPSYDFTEFRSDLVLRWDYQPGSSLFLAWKRERTDYDTDGGAYDLGRDLMRITGLEDHTLIPTTDIFLLKLSYWLGK